jgi:hypothetical protein
MRRATILGLTFVLAVHSAAAQDTTRFGDEAAQNLFVRSRAAVAHAGTVTQLRSLMLRGHLRTMADNGAPLDGAIEIKVLLPDNFLRIETYADVQRYLGFSGRSLLTAIREGNRIELPPEKAAPQMLRATQAHFTRLMLGVATYITSDRQMTIRSSGGAAAAVADAIAAAPDAIILREVESAAQLAERLARWSQDLAASGDLRPTLPGADSESVASTSPSTADARLQCVRDALAALARRQLLCALREGPFGALTANAAIERALRKAWRIGANAEWYAGRAIIVTRNDYAARLFNGDVGICLADNDGRLRVWFEAPGSHGAVRGFAPNTLPLPPSQSLPRKRWTWPGSPSLKLWYSPRPSNSVVTDSDTLVPGARSVISRKLESEPSMGPK